MKTITLIALTFLFTIGAVAQGGVRDYKVTKVSPASSAIMDFEREVSRLVYLSETEELVSSYTAPRYANVLTTDEFLRVNVLPSDTPIVEMNLGLWVQRQAVYDARWNSVYLTLQSRLSEVKLYRVGNIQVVYYAVGIIDNRLVGIKAFSVET